MAGAGWPVRDGQYAVAGASALCALGGSSYQAWPKPTRSAGCISFLAASVRLPDRDG
jgi:hypothetical protein